MVFIAVKETNDITTRIGHGNIACALIHTSITHLNWHSECCLRLVCSPQARYSIIEKDLEKVI